MASNNPTLKKMLSTSSSTSSLNSFAKEKAAYHDEESGGPKKLKLFESPLAHERAKSQTISRVQSVISIAGPLGIASDRSGQASVGNIYDDRAAEEDEQNKARAAWIEMRDTPEFRRYEEATNIELFYDLFFVANLTTFTNVHDINDSEALKAYAGFFCILWFLWCQVSLFDVRFVTDSILERFGKACQFGVMIGLAVVGPDFNTSDQNAGTFQSLAIILMLSRIVLGFQYLTVLWHLWHYKDSKTPLAVVTASTFVAALVYFTTFFGFKERNPTGSVFIVWYITAIIETMVNVSLSSQWKVLSFTGTHLVQRMSLLTLIILGEGIIGVSKSIATIVENETSWTASLTATILAAVVIIVGFPSPSDQSAFLLAVFWYFIYMIYFDWMNKDNFGSVRQEIWAFLHFPFHLALILLLEGTSQFIVWRKVVEVVRAVKKQFTVALNGFTGTSSAQLAQVLPNITNDVFTQFNPEFEQTYIETQRQLYSIGNATFNSTEQIADIGTLFSVIQDSLFDDFEIEPPETNTTTADPNDQWNKNMDTFMLFYVYFFVAAGLTLILMNILNLISLPTKTLRDRVRILVNSIVGILLCLLATIVNTTSGFNFAQSAWVLLAVAFTFVSVMAYQGFVKM